MSDFLAKRKEASATWPIEEQIKCPQYTMPGNKADKMVDMALDTIKLHELQKSDRKLWYRFKIEYENRYSMLKSKRTPRGVEPGEEGYPVDCDYGEGEE